MEMKTTANVPPPTSDWVMDPLGRKTCNTKFFSPLLELMKNQKEYALKQIAYLDMIIDFLTKLEQEAK